MGEETDSVRVWLVERTFTEKPSLINHVYATTDGEQYFLRERSITGGSQSGATTTAAVEVAPADLTPVEEDTVREQYAAEAERMANIHTPDDRI